MKNDTATLLKQLALMAALALFVSSAACRSTKENLNRPAENSNASAPAQPVSQSAFDVVDSKVIEKVSPFDHGRKEHQTKVKDCAFCHVRKDNSATPVFPSHPACIECHQRDFTNRQSRMCEVCHTVPVDAKGTLIEFPKKQSEFGLKGFSHRQHGDPAKMKDQMADNPAGAPDCSKCHKTAEAAQPARADITEINVARGQRHHSDCWDCHVTARESACTKCHRSSVPF